MGKDNNILLLKAFLSMIDAKNFKKVRKHHFGSVWINFIKFRENLNFPDSSHMKACQRSATLQIEIAQGSYKMIQRDHKADHSRINEYS